MQSEEGTTPKRPRLTLASVRARTKARTDFALQVLAASQAALDATDALLAASDALLAAPRPSTGAKSQSNEPTFNPAVIPPEACEASDSSDDSETQSSDLDAREEVEQQQQQRHQQLTLQQPQPQPQQIHAPITSKSQIPIFPQSAPPASLVKNGKEVAEDGSDSSSAEESSEAGSESGSGSGSGSSSHEITDSELATTSTSNVGSDASNKNSALSVNVVIKGDQPPPSQLAKLPLSGSIVSGSFDTKTPIPQFIGTSPRGDEGATSALASKSSSPSLGILTSDEDEDMDTGSSLEDDSSEESSSIESGSSSSAASDGPSESAATSINDKSTTTPSESDAYVDELIGEIRGGVSGSIKGNSAVSQAQLAALFQKQPDQQVQTPTPAKTNPLAPAAPPQLNAPQTLPQMKDQPPAPVATQLKAPQTLPQMKVQQSIPQPTPLAPPSQPQTILQAAMVPQQSKPHPQVVPHPKWSLPPGLEDDDDDDDEESASDDESSEEDSSEEDSELESSSGSGMSDQAAVTPSAERPSSETPSDKPSETNTSSDIEEDDYVEELLSELKETKGGLLFPTPHAPMPKGMSASVVTASTASVTTASTAPPTIKQQQPPIMRIAPPQPIEDDEDDDDDSEEDSDDDDDSDEDSDDSSAESSDDVESGDEGEEDDEYVDELLKELQATKPSSLVPEHKFPAPMTGIKPEANVVPTGIVKDRIIQAVGSETDDDVSDIASSSSEYDSSDSDLFSTDGEEEESSDDDDIGGSSGGLISSDEYTTDGDDDDDDEYVDDLLNELQAPRVAAPAKPKASPAQPPMLPTGPGGFPMPPMGLPMMAAPLPGEGLNLEAIRSELEKVGRAVMTQKSGEAFVARAQILASINQLSSHVPNCVLDFLGKEIRAEMERKKRKADKKEKAAEGGGKHKMIDLVSSGDDMSEVSDLSSLDISEPEEDTGVGFFIDTSGVNLGDSDADRAPENAEDVSPKQEVQTPVAMMRRKSEEALDEMFRKAREDGSVNKSVADLSEDIDNIFNSSNDYGLTKAKAGSRSSYGSIGSMESSTGSSGSRDFLRKSRNHRGSTAGSISWGLEGKLPSVSRFECALLFVDISGFTKLSTLLDPETLSKVINSYFQLIVSKIYEFNGDIQKFAGDAIFAEWRCTDKDPMDFCVAAATACASQIVDECSDFPVMAGGAQNRNGEPISSLNVHCALGSGQMIGIHVGDNTRRREYLFLGEPIDQLTWGADLAKHGELVVSPEAFRSLSLAGVLDFNIRPSESEPAIIAKRCVTMFRSEFLKDYRVSRAEYARSRGVTGHVEGLEVEDLKTYQKLMALYVHPVIAAMHMDQTSKMKTKSSAQERHREEAELRRVYIMFIHPLITISEDNDYAVDLLNEIMNLTSTQLERYCGHLRQMIVDDKGLVLIGTFGLRGSTFPNMVAERALPATIALHNALQSQLGVDNRIGATFGEVYCGAVGGVKRHEYAVLGPSANLAARLMGNKNNPGILVECNIRRMASRKYAFNALPPVKAKGYAEPVPIFEPLSPLERSWGRIQPNFVGREQEIKALMGMARDIVSQEEPQSRLVFVASQSGMGKSTMVAHAIEHIRRLIGDNTRRLVITKQVGKESHSLVPFGMFRSILLDVLANFAASTDDKSQASGVSGFSAQSLSLQSLSCRSQGSSTALSLAKSEELLKVLCRELNAPSGFVDHILHHLSGKGSSKLPSGKAPSMKSMVSFMERAFRRCTQETKIVVVALDDVQYIDEMTWKVLRRVFEDCDNVLMICAFDLSRSRDLKVEADFWQVLNQKYRPSGHFVPMELAGLGKEEITVMTMKTLGLQREEVPHDLLNEVLIQSGGMPHFANEFLELVKRRQFTEMMDGRAPKASSGGETSMMGPNALGSVPEIILHRIDSFDVGVRNILNIAAVLGKSFTLKEVIAVLKENHDMREDILEKEAIKSLEMAVNEGILRMEQDPDAEDEEEESKARDAKGKPESSIYSFYHGIWQTTILSLMLDARKRDVHSKIAMSMEKGKGMEDGDFAFQMKLLGHWKYSGNTSKLTELALDVGKRFEQKLGMPTQSIRVYEEALDAWKSDKPTEQVGGICFDGLGATAPEELEHISALHVALGRAFNGAQRNADSALSFHDALQILRRPKQAENVTDRSVAFPAYCGLYECIKAKYIVQDNSNRYEQLLIKKFLEDTKNHSETFHHAHALTCQIDLYRRGGEMDKAVGIHKLLYNVYDHVKHSKKLRDTYGSDEAAVSFANSAMWYWHLGDKEAALDACRFVIGKLMPKMDRSDVHQSFVMMYPVVLVMKDTGVAAQARKHFDRLVVKPFSTFFGEGKSSFFLPVYEPIMMLLHLVGTSDLDEDTLEEYAEWALDRDRLSFGTLANRRLGALGRCADSLSAEICFLLAERIDEEETRNVLIEHGREIGQEALVFNAEQELVDAERQVAQLLEKYESLITEMDE